MNRAASTTIASLVFVMSGFQFLPSSSLAQCTGDWTQRTTAAAPSPRDSHAMAYDSARGVTVLFGGNTGLSRSAETWEWDGTTWALANAAMSPSARDSHAMAFDSARGVTVLFGAGSAGAVLPADMWEWDGVNWLEKTTAIAPSARIDFAMAYDSARGVTVLFGGQTMAGNSSETWEWDGTNWRLRAPADSPSARNEHAMAYDAARGVTVLFGGYDGDLNGETWEWDGTNWTQRMPAIAPSPRGFHSMAYDSARAVTVLFGGYNDVVDNRETWEWDGTNWTRRIPAAAPSAREVHAMAFDAAQRVTVLFGGYDGASDNETWEWVGPRPAISQQPAALMLEAGQSASFSVVADGAAPLSYQWRKDGAPLSNGGAIAGATTDSLTIDPTAETDGGNYDCEISNPCGSAISQAATLMITPPPDTCGACGGGLPALMPVMLLGIARLRCQRRARPYYEEERVSQ